MMEVLLSQKNMDAFSHLIPDMFKESLRTENLFGVGLWDEMFDAPMAVLLVRESHEWMELVWTAVDEDYRGLMLPSYLMEGAIRRARRAKQLWGVFADLPDGETNAYFKKLFQRMEFSFQKNKEPLFVMPLEAAAENETLQKMNQMKNVVALQDTDDAMRRAVVAAIRADNKNVPLPKEPDWDSYEQQLSAIYIVEGKPKGLLLFTRMEKDLVISCAWAAVPVALPKLIALTMRTAQKAHTLYPSGMQIVIPAITDVSLRLVQNLFPEAKMQETEQARLYFRKIEEVSFL